MLINPDFRMQLEETGGDAPVRRFKPLIANRYELSIQPSEDADLGSSFAPEDCERWEVALRAPEQTSATPRSHPFLFPESPWRQYWTGLRPGEVTASNVPTEVVQTFLDFLALGPELYEEMTSMQ